MADDDLIEDFNITENDLDSAFNPTRSRRGRQSKEEAIYGIWATAAEKNYNRPTTASSYSRGPQGIAFVSGGLKSGSKIEKPKASKETKKKPTLVQEYDSDDDDSDANNDDDDDDDEVEVISKRRRRRQDDSSGNDDDSDNEEEPEEVNQPIGSSDDEIERPIPQRQPPNIQYRRTPQGNTAVPVDKDFGAFEKHTKGIGMKLLLKMGFKKGGGLGKDGRGRALPIQVVKRQGKGAIGRYGNEDPNRAVPTQESDATDSTRSTKSKDAVSMPQWRKQQREKTPKQKYVYKTFNDVLKEQSTKFQNNKKSAGQNKEKIIDMTGREQRVLQGYDAMSNRNFDNEQAFSLSELTHNLDLVIESCEESMIRSHRRRKFDEDTSVTLEHDIKYTEQVISDEEASMKKLNVLLNMINQCEECVKHVQKVSDLFFLQRMFDELKRNYESEYKKYRLWDLAVPVLHNHLKQHLAANWNLQNDDQESREIFSKWRQILEDNTIDLTIEDATQVKENMDPYHRLVWDVWMPFLRRSVLDWNSRQPELLIDFLERWKPLLPKWIMENILDQLILPVLHREVNAWNPLTDSVPIHSWLHPWLPLMAERLEPLYQPIRTKLAEALQGWQPSDSSAKAVLLPWQKVFKPATWDSFMNRYIVPKLVAMMQQFIVNPRQQSLDAWNWFIAWYEMVPLSSMIAILEKSFFPKWLHVLHVWLNTNPNYQEIHQWYSGWRALLPPGIVSHTVINEKLKEGLMMIDRAVSGVANVQAQPSPPPPPPSANINFETLYDRGIAAAAATRAASFKDIVENKAAEQNIMFLPIPSRAFEGKQIYQFGKVNIYIDKRVIFIFENGQWIPIHLHDLIMKAL